MKQNGHDKRNKHKSCEHREHGGHDQSQVKIIKSSKKVKSVLKDVPKSHNDDTRGRVMGE